MKKILTIILLITVFSLSIFAIMELAASGDQIVVEAQSGTYIVQRGDSLWKIAVKYETGLSEIIKANPQIKNPAMIYPGQKIYIPETAPLKNVETEIVRLVNAERAKRGLQQLTINWQVARVARIKSQDMINNNYFAHISPVYGSPFKMLESFKLRYSAAAENIAYGQRSAQEVMNSWMNSPGHRANILSGNVTQIGVGVAKKANGTMYFTQIFIKPI
ncbi:MAG: SafA/ExsA family spore coat assembly protein [Clostridia bacterium]|nr:SafA/ExsA family spore coat assembly protein [Clostridia bacterium]